MKFIICISVAVMFASIALALGSNSASFFVLPFVQVAIFIYLIPAIVAHERRHREEMAISVLTLLLGWTFMGWVVALIWACTSDVLQIEEDKSAARETGAEQLPLRLVKRA